MEIVSVHIFVGRCYQRKGLCVESFQVLGVEWRCRLLMKRESQQSIQDKSRRKDGEVKAATNRTIPCDTMSILPLDLIDCS